MLERFLLCNVAISFWPDMLFIHAGQLMIVTGMILNNGINRYKQTENK